MKKELSNRVAVITGASSGIGYAIAKCLFKEGVKVYDISRTVHDNPEITQAFQANVNDYIRIDEILSEIYNKNKHIDIFINNAGFGIAGAIENTKAENIYNQVNTNLSSVITLSSLAIKYLKKSGGGNIINISSVGGIIPLPFQATYSATKAGVEIFSKALANEVKQFNVKVCAVLPGDTKTNFTNSRVVDNNEDNLEYKQKIEHSIKKMANDEQKGTDPIVVGKTVVKILKKKNPPLRKTIGLSYKFIVFITRFLSSKFINKIVRKLYC